MLCLLDNPGFARIRGFFLPLEKYPQYFPAENQQIGPYKKDGCQGYITHIHFFHLG